MIIKGGSRSNGGFFAAHLAREDTNERVHVVETRGLVADDIEGSFQELAGVASGMRAKNFFYVSSLNPCEHERLSPEQWNQAADTLERHLGLTGQPRLVVEHEKEGRTHRHVVWSRINLDSMTAISDSLTYPKHEAAAREIEQAFGLEPVESVLVRDREGERPERRPRDYEGFRAQETGIDPRAMKAEITALWQEADSGLAFKAALEEAGYILARGDRRDFCIIDREGDEHSLARRISGAKAAEIRARLSDIDREALPSVAEAREIATTSDAASGDPVSEQPGERRPEGEPEQPGQRRHQGEPEEPGESRPAAASGGDIERAQSDDSAPERVSPWGSGWRAFAERALQYADQVYVLWRDETSGANSPGEPRSWISRVMEVGRHLLHGWKHGDATEVAEGIVDAAALVHDLTRAEPPPDPNAFNVPPEDSGGDLPRPGGKVEPPAPDDAPQERHESIAGAAATLSDIGTAYEEALRRSSPSDASHDSDAPDIAPPHDAQRGGPELV